jgi:hypothetical protein
MDRANAIRLLEALMAGGKYSGKPIATAWIHKKAWEIGFEGQNLVSALAYAGNEGWQVLLTGRTEAAIRNLVRLARRG